eukprot:6583184-Pyramimonas_sp.AAC.2
MVRTKNGNRLWVEDRKVSARTLALKPSVVAFTRPRPAKTTSTNTLRLGPQNAAWATHGATMANMAQPMSSVAGDARARARVAVVATVGERRDLARTGGMRCARARVRLWGEERKEPVQLRAVSL